MKWIEDDAGDAVNLYHVETIMVCALTGDQEAPEGATHELLAVNANQESYRLTSGSEDSVRTYFNTVLKPKLGL